MAALASAIDVAAARSSHAQCSSERRRESLFAVHHSWARVAEDFEAVYRMMLATIASLCAIGWLPGAVIFRLPVADRAKRAALPAEERVFWAVVISVTTTTTLAFALAAMGCVLARPHSYGAVSGLPLCLRSRRAVIYGSALLPRGPIGSAAIPCRADRARCVDVLRDRPAAEYVIGGRDPGVYINEGIQIAQSRSLVTVDRVAASVPAATRDLFFPSVQRPSYYSVRFMGFHLRDPEAGTVTGQFPQGYPVWIAIAYGLDGVTGTRRVIAWWAILGVLTVYFAGRRLIGPLPAAAAAALLSRARHPDLVRALSEF